MKKAYAIGLIVVLSLLLLLSAFLVINGVQRDQAVKTVRTFVYEDDRTNMLSNEQGVRKTVDCRPAGSVYSKCQALEYTVSQGKCVNLIQNFKPAATACNADIELTYHNEHIKIIAGSLYGTEQRQFQIILNEPHLLSMWK
jgi:hypothetical protein